MTSAHMLQLGFRTKDTQLPQSRARLILVEIMSEMDDLEEFPKVISCFP